MWRLKPKSAFAVFLWRENVGPFNALLRLGNVSIRAGTDIRCERHERQQRADSCQSLRYSSLRCSFPSAVTRGIGQHDLADGGPICGQSRLVQSRLLLTQHSSLAAAAILWRRSKVNHRIYSNLLNLSDFTRTRALSLIGANVFLAGYGPGSLGHRPTARVSEKCSGVGRFMTMQR